MDKHTDDFEFQLWVELADANPDAFELARAHVLESLIESAPEANRKRLRGLQWQIDRVRERAPNPLASCFHISDMMWDKVLGENGLVAHVEQLTGARPRPRGPVNSADILPFEKPRQQHS